MGLSDCVLYKTSSVTSKEESKFGTKHVLTTRTKLVSGQQKNCPSPHYIGHYLASLLAFIISLVVKCCDYISVAHGNPPPEILRCFESADIAKNAAGNDVLHIWVQSFVITLHVCVCSHIYGKAY